MWIMRYSKLWCHEILFDVALRSIPSSHYHVWYYIVFEYYELDNEQNNLFKVIFENPDNPSSEEIWDNTITVLYDYCMINTSHHYIWNTQDYSAKLKRS